MDFFVVAKTFEEINALSSRTAITRHLADLLKQASPEEAGIICNLSLGLLRPPYKGSQFNFAEKNLIKVIAQLTQESEETVAKHAKEKGDIGSVLDNAAWKHKDHLSVTKVYDSLCALEKISGTGSQEEKISSAVKLLKEVDPLSAKYIVRIILGILRLGFSDMTIIDALSWMEKGDKSLSKVIEHAYNISADIGLIAQTLKEKGIKAVEHMKVTVGIPIRPAAAERLPNAKAIFEKLGDGCAAEPKVDGFRLQIHAKKEGSHTEVHLFSRNLLDMTYMFPDIVSEVKKLNFHTLIMEGETVAYDENTGRMLPFQETVKRKRKHGIEEAISEFPLRVYLFAALNVDGVDLMPKAHDARHNALKEVLKGYKGNTFVLIEQKVMHSAQDIEDYFLQNIDAGLEGIMVKKPSAHYEAGKRNFNWIKLKREVYGHLEDTIDCVILGYYSGSGKRAEFGIGAFLVGVYNPKKDAFETIAKVGSGLTDAGWKELKAKCDKLKVATRPVNVICAKELYPDVWVSPVLVGALKADEITLSPLHTAGKTEQHLGYALRFPRFLEYRPDKSATDATTIQEIKRLYEDQFGQKK